MPKLKVINLFGAPGVGKSAACAGLFYLMKKNHFSVEQVTEYAKYLILSGNQKALENEPSKLLAEQYHKQEILKGVYDYAVTDSPLLLVNFYNQNKKSHFDEFALGLFNEFDNINLFITREISVSEYETRGRIHSLEESRAVATQMRQYLLGRGLNLIDCKIEREKDVAESLFEILNSLEKSGRGYHPLSRSAVLSRFSPFNS